MVVYMTTNLINGKKYIGKDTKNKKSYLGSGSYLRKAIEKYGRENFKKEILEVCSSHDELMEREEYWLNYYDAGKNKMFYNVHNHSYGGAYGEDNPMFGKSPSMEVRKRISKSLKGKFPSKETREKLSKSRTGEKNPMFGKFGELHPMGGRDFSPLHRKKLSEKKIGENNPRYGKSKEESPVFKGYVICISGLYVGQKQTRIEWANILGIFPENFSKHLNGKLYKNGIKGNFFKWEHDVVL